MKPELYKSPEEVREYVKQVGMEVWPRLFSSYAATPRREELGHTERVGDLNLYTLTCYPVPLTRLESFRYSHIGSVIFALSERLGLKWTSVELRSSTKPLW